MGKGPTRLEAENKMWLTEVKRTSNLWFLDVFSNKFHFPFDRWFSFDLTFLSGACLKPRYRNFAYHGPDPLDGKHDKLSEVDPSKCIRCRNERRNRILRGYYTRQRTNVLAITLFLKCWTTNEQNGHGETVSISEVEIFSYRTLKQSLSNKLNNNVVYDSCFLDRTAETLSYVRILRTIYIIENLQEREETTSSERYISCVHAYIHVYSYIFN